MSERGDCQQPQEAATGSLSPGRTRGPGGSRSLGRRAQVDPSIAGSRTCPAQKWMLDKFLSPDPTVGRGLRRGGPGLAVGCRAAFQAGMLQSRRKAPIYGDSGSIFPTTVPRLPPLTGDD